MLSQIWVRVVYKGLSLKDHDGFFFLFKGIEVFRNENWWICQKSTCRALGLFPTKNVTKTKLEYNYLTYARKNFVCVLSAYLGCVSFRFEKIFYYFCLKSSKRAEPARKTNEWLHLEKIFIFGLFSFEKFFSVFSSVVFFFFFFFLTSEKELCEFKQLNDGIFLLIFPLFSSIFIPVQHVFRVKYMTRICKTKIVP